MDTITSTRPPVDPTAEINLDTVKHRAVKGIIALSGRTFVLQAIAFASFTLFGAFLNSAEYGVYVLVLAVKNFFAYFSDVGLSAALIQKKENVSREDLRTSFTIQQILVILAVVIIFLATPFFVKVYHLEQQAVWLLWALAVSLLLSSLKTIPSVLLERRLEFGKLVLPQIIESLLFNLIAVYMVWKGFGVTSFTFAVLAQSVVGLVLIYVIQPWMPGISFSLSSIKQLFKFGIPYQINTFLAVIKDDGLIIFLGGILGTSGLGLLIWAQKWGQAPLRFFMDQVIKVTFPAYSRMQDNKEELSKAVSRSIFFICFLVFPSLVGLVILAPLLVEIIPKYGKWQPAILALTFFSVSAALAAVTTPLTNMLNAIGKIKITFKLMIMWTVLTWLLVPYLAKSYGFTGAAAGAMLVGTSSLVAIFVAYKNVRFALSSIFKPLVASIIMLGILYMVRNLETPSLYWVMSLIVFGIVSYLGVIYLLVGPTLIADTKKVLYAFRNIPK